MDRKMGEIKRGEEIRLKQQPKQQHGIERGQEIDPRGECDKAEIDNKLTEGEKWYKGKKRRKRELR